MIRCGSVSGARKRNGATTAADTTTSRPCSLTMFEDENAPRSAPDRVSGKNPSSRKSKSAKSSAPIVTRSEPISGPPLPPDEDDDDDGIAIRVLERWIWRLELALKDARQELKYKRMLARH